MAASSETSGVIFTDDKATYRPGNGNVINYKRVGGIYYHTDTPDAVVRALEQARSSSQRVRLYYGDAETGRDWLEESDVTGYVRNSVGPLKVPILVHNRRSHAGGAILDRCLVKIRWTSGGIIYQHAQYHAGSFVIREIGPNETFHDGNLRDKGFTHAVDVDGKNHANFQSMAAARRYLRKMIG
jgi:hypothetical protein